MKIKNVQRIIFLVFFSLLSNHAWAGWISFDKSEIGDVYYAENSIKKLDKSIILVWNKVILSKEAKTKYFSILKGINKQPQNPSMLSYYKKLIEIDCVNRKIKDNVITFYDEKGKVVYASPKSESGEWNDILPDTVGEKLIKIVSCEAVPPKEAAAPKVEEPVTPKEAVVAAAAPTVADKYIATISSKQKEQKNLWAADWIYCDKTAVGDMYYDKSSIKQVNESIISVQNKHILSAEAKTKFFSIFKKIQNTPDNPSMFSYYINSTEIDCVNKKIRDISVIFYDEKGEVFYSLPKGQVGDWSDVLPNTSGEKLLNMVSCGPVAPKAAVVAPMIEEPAAAAPAVTDKNSAQVKSEPQETKNVQNLINKWLISWQSGDMKTYRSFYASDFQSGGMTLDEWVSHRTDVYNKSKNINISIINLKISEEENGATAEFTQSYSSSISKYSGTKKLSLRKINDQWKIYREVLN